MESLDRDEYVKRCFDRSVCPLKPEYLADPTRFWPLSSLLQDGEETATSAATTHTTTSQSPVERGDIIISATRGKKRGLNKDRRENFSHFKELASRQICQQLATRNVCEGMESGSCGRKHALFATVDELLADLGKRRIDCFDENEPCPVFQLKGICPQGLNCRVNPLLHVSKEGKNVAQDREPVSAESFLHAFGNQQHGYEVFRKTMRARKVFEKSDEMLAKLTRRKNARDAERVRAGKGNCDDGNPLADDGEESENAEPPNNKKAKIEAESGGQVETTVDENDDVAREVKETKEKKESGSHDAIGGVVIDSASEIRMKKRERSKFLMKDKLILAPLTTVGNLPFRRLCIKQGADVTISEMILATQVLQGAPTDTAMMKRHESEKIFGIQVAGGYPDQMSRFAEMVEDQLSKEPETGIPKIVDCDFIDINMGCPIDSLANRGAGCQLMTRQTHLQSIVESMSEILSVPLTIKMRTGFRENKPVIAHELIPKVCSWGVSAITLHGRTGQQRYSKMADWEYMAECKRVCSEDVTFVGNGDIFDPIWYKSSDYKMDSLMIGRGALIKPWIFKEMKEGSLWDVSSSERFDILKDFCRFGIEHWGCDEKGIENTRRFLLENLSFMCRYVPVGLLERVPQKLNLRPPAFCGRDELETLMGSQDCQDWIKLTERLLGKVPEGYSFAPKHNSHSYD